MNYQETVAYLYYNLPFFQKDGAKALRPKLDNTLALCAFLENPQNKLKHIHVAGTNGKGSTSHLLAAILAEHGFKVGLYTSPHLQSFTERIKINGIEIPEHEVIDFVSIIQSKIEEIRPSFFEVTVAMAFWYFEKQKTDICVIEVGLGGRLDSTNIIKPIVSVITNISLDHQQYLGNSIEEIAAEKAGIIKPNTPVVIGEVQAQTLGVFQSIAHKNKAVLKTELNTDRILIDCKTETYQDKNIETVLKTIEVLDDMGFDFDEKNMRYAIQNFKEITNFKGRWQTLNEQPKIICDTGHNEAGISEVIKMLAQESYEQLHFVFGMVAEKDITNVLEILPQNAIFYFCKANNSRCLDAAELKNRACTYQLKGDSYPSVASAIGQAQQNAKPKDLIFIGGSNFVVAEIPFL